MAWSGMANRMLGVAVRTFSEPSVYWLTDGVEPGVELPQAVFDSAHVEIDPETQAPVSSTNPVLGVRLSDLPNERTPRDRVRVRDQLYRISDVQPDGVAGALIVLKKV
ncbi:head-tail joining protein [Azotobacter salinestris]|uniref:head-tail joining protein n=1 Tax=Azotobacter salinestris TaxID=69964 RepID=UPI0032E039CE